MVDDLIRKSDVLETYADLYDIFDDNKAIQEELHKVFDKINNIPSVESNNSEIPNNCDTCRFELYCPEMCEGCCEWDSHYEPKDEPQTMYYPQVDGITPSVIVKTEPTISKMEQVDELQTKDYCDICNHKGCEYCISDSRNPYCIPSNYEPQTEGNE